MVNSEGNEDKNIYYFITICRWMRNTEQEPTHTELTDKRQIIYREVVTTMHTEKERDNIVIFYTPYFVMPYAAIRFTW